MSAAEDRALLQEFEDWITLKGQEVDNVWTIDRFLQEREDEANRLRIADAIEQASIYVNNWEQRETITPDDAATAMQRILSILVDDREVITEMSITGPIRSYTA